MVAVSEENRNSGAFKKLDVSSVRFKEKMSLVSVAWALMEKEHIE